MEYQSFYNSTTPERNDKYLLILIIIAALGVWVSLPIMLSQEVGEYAVVYGDNVEIAKLDLSVDEVYEYKVSDYDYLLGDMEIEVKDGKVAIIEETSPNNTCSNMGWIYKASESLICIPNNVYVLISGTANAADEDEGIIG